MQMKTFVHRQTTPLFTYTIFQLELFFGASVMLCALFHFTITGPQYREGRKVFFLLKGEEKTSKHETRCKKYMRRLWAQLNVKQMQTMLHMNWGRRHLFDKLKFVLFVCFVLFFGIFAIIV